MNTSDLEGATLDYWVARGLHEFIREIHFTDSGETLSIRGNDRGKPWDGRFLPSTSWDAAAVVLERACKLEMHDHGRGEVVCTVTFGKESLAGKCVTPPADAPDTRLVCRPDKMPEGHGPGGHRGHGGRPHGPPPEEVFVACDGKAAGAACSVKIGDHTLDGTCKAPPPGVNETRLGCAPPHSASPADEG